MVRKQRVQPSTGPSGMLVAGVREMGPKRLTLSSRPPGWHSEDQLPGVRLSSAGEEGRKGVGSQEQEHPSQIYDGGGGTCTSHPRVAMQVGGNHLLTTTPSDAGEPWGRCLESTQPFIPTWKHPEHHPQFASLALSVYSESLSS